MIIETIIVIVIAFMVTALPLHLAARMLGGKSTIFKAIIVNIVIGFVIAGIHIFFPFANIIAFIALIWIYREMFRLKWFKAFLAWIIQITLTIVFILLFGIIFGISLFL